ncbi:helix-turn-helix domain-containing protein [Candidatus Peregrinibacteria bacterium]|nr:helix-turn-helix domain-containing protein [Candidatus Peregrinibacteria bacterium]
MVENFLTTEQVAKSLQVHPFTVLKLIKAKKIPAIKIGKMYRIRESDLNKFLEASAKEVRPTSHTTEETKTKPAPQTAPHKPTSTKDHFIIK